MHFTVRSTYTCCIRHMWQITFDWIWFEVRDLTFQHSIKNVQNLSRWNMRKSSTVCMDGKQGWVTAPTASSQPPDSLPGSSGSALHRHGHMSCSARLPRTGASTECTMTNRLSLLHKKAYSVYEIIVSPFLHTLAYGYHCPSIPMTRLLPEAHRHTCTPGQH